MTTRSEVGFIKKLFLVFSFGITNPVVLFQIYIIKFLRGIFLEGWLEDWTPFLGSICTLDCYSADLRPLLVPIFQHLVLQ